MRIGAMEDIYTALSRKGEVEFDYKDKSYMIEPELHEGKKYLMIWTTYLESDNLCVFKEELNSDEEVTKDMIDRALNAKCFDGKSFVEIQQDVELTFMVVID